MEDIIPLLWFLFLAIMFITVMTWKVHQASALTETYRNLAARLGGSALGGGRFGRPSLSFHHEGAWVMVDIASTGGKSPTYYTQVHIAWPDRTTRCEVYPERFTSRVGKMMGMIDVEIGSPKFDADFVVTGNSPRALRDLLTPAVQEAIYRLLRMGPNYDVYVSIGGGKMLVKKMGLIRHEESLHEFIDAALDLFDRAIATSGEGIEILSHGASSPESEVTCQICGEAITEELVRCRRCKTPHHEDCWQYFGGCSTFGCGGKQYAGGKSVDRPRRIRRR